MRKTLLAMAVLGGLTIAAPRAADARVGVWLGFPGVSIFTGPPVVPVPVVPQPYYYAPPAYYAPPPVVVGPPCYRRPYPYYGYGGPRRWRGGPPGWRGRW